MLIVLPLLAFCLLYLFLMNTFQNEDWRRLLLASVLLFSTYLVFATELLSLFQGITMLGLAAVWLVPILALAAWIYWKVKSGSKIHLPIWKFPRQPGELILLAGIIVILLITATIALIAPPHSWDTINYHMPRVAQWAQNQSLRPFVTGIDVQNSMPPLNEMMILHTYVLAAGDRFANMVQWLSMAGSIIIVSLIAHQLGVNKQGQYLAALTAAAIPVGISQASTSMTDYTGAIFIMAAASEILGMAKEKPGRSHILLTSIAAGLALLAKPTSAAYLLPLAVFAAVVILLKGKPSLFLKAGLASLIVVLLLNAGQLARNYDLYGNPLNDPDRISSHSNQLHTLEGWASNIIRNAALHTGTTSVEINQFIYHWIVVFHDRMRLDASDPRTTLAAPFYWVPFRTAEDLAGNLIHSVLIIFTFAILFLFRKRFNRLTLIYALVSVLTFILVSGLFKWQPFSSRFHLAFFLMFAPLIAYAATRTLPGFIQVLLGIFLLAAAYPWLLSQDYRPIFPSDKSYSPSIFTTTREELLFVTAGSLDGPYSTLLDTAGDNGCSQIGLMLLNSAAEYPLWVLADAPNKDMYFEWIIAGPSDKYATPDFQPCAIICQGCDGDEWQDVRGLQRLYAENGFQIYFPAGTVVKNIE
ncbi:MAG: hypothetical protein EHM41_06410 [Chloroflexi bacterium]|nr:MAG: hypothetical protein EHM41_06410 [Chloroflexota bacterium]